MDWLELRMGHKARQQVLDHGLAPSMVSTVAAAAGGTKAISLAGLDSFIFSEFLTQSPCATGQKRLLVGASVGSWKMAAVCSKKPDQSLAALIDNYLQTDWDFDAKWSPDQVLDQLIRQLDGVIGGRVRGSASFMDYDNVVNHSGFDLAVILNNALPALAPDGLKPSLLRFGKLGLHSQLGRKPLGKYLHRWVLATGQTDFLNTSFDEIPTQSGVLSAVNLKPTLLASATLPFLSKPLTEIPQVGKGVFLDGGLTDVDLVLPYSQRPELTLYPHFYGALRQSWFDKYLRNKGANRKYDLDALSNIVLLSPSRKWVESLPDKSLLGRKAMFAYGSLTKERVRSWSAVKAQSQLLADDFQTWLHMGCPMDDVLPLTWPSKQTFAEPNACLP